MSTNTGIEWAESTWNPVTGCTKVSPGCKFCYAERMAKRLKAMGQKNYVNGFNLTEHKTSVNLPLSWKKPQIIFVNSMSDLFHESVSLSFILSIFRTMEAANWHIFQILTKRSERLLTLDNQIRWPKNVWMGVSVENDKYLHRIEHLKKSSAVVKFVSCEPLLGPLPQMNLNNIDWVIVGGESGPGARPVKKDWIIDIRNLCFESDVPFFFKQWGGVFKKKNGRILDDQTYSEMPHSFYSSVYYTKSA